MPAARQQLAEAEDALLLARWPVGPSDLDEARANVEAADENLGSLWVITVLPVILYVVGGVLIAVSIVLMAVGGRGRHSSGVRAPTREKQPV